MCKKNLFGVTIVAVMLLGFSACGQRKNIQNDVAIVDVDAAHNSRNSLEWAGIYTGFIPCADCDGINVTLTLNADETYSIVYRYDITDKQKSDGGNHNFETNGKFSWDQTGSVVTLDAPDYPPHYKVGENKLIQLDMAGNEITGELADKYVLNKQ